MKKLVALPALALAVMFIATASSAAPKKPGGKWVWIAAGERHQVRKSPKAYALVREAAKEDWDTHSLVTIDEPVKASDNCKWVGHTAPPPDLMNAKLFVQTDDKNKTRLYIMLDDSSLAPIVRELTPDDATSNSWKWLSSKGTNDWDYYVLLEDTDPRQDVGKPIEKRYRVEIFPPADACHEERPDYAMALPTTTTMKAPTKAKPCQAGGGTGNEPNR